MEISIQYVFLCLEMFGDTQEKMVARDARLASEERRQMYFDLVSYNLVEFVY